MFNKNKLPKDIYTLRIGAIIQPKVIIHDKFLKFNNQQFIADDISYIKLFDLDIYRAYCPEVMFQWNCQNDTVVESFIFERADPIEPQTSDEWNMWLNDKDGLINDELLNAPDGLQYGREFNHSVPIQEFRINREYKMNKRINLFSNEDVYLLLEHVDHLIQPYFGILQTMEVF